MDGEIDKWIIFAAGFVQALFAIGTWEFLRWLDRWWVMRKQDREARNGEG